VDARRVPERVEDRVPVVVREVREGDARRGTEEEGVDGVDLHRVRVARCRDGIDRLGFDPVVLGAVGDNVRCRDAGPVVPVDGPFSAVDRGPDGRPSRVSDEVDWGAKLV
jgi:hypothetical protein